MRVEPPSHRLRLGGREKEESFLLMGATLAGLVLNRQLGDGAPGLLCIVEVGSSPPLIQGICQLVFISAGIGTTVAFHSGR